MTPAWCIPGLGVTEIYNNTVVVFPTIWFSSPTDQGSRHKKRHVVGLLDSSLRWVQKYSSSKMVKSSQQRHLFSVYCCWYSCCFSSRCWTSKKWIFMLRHEPWWSGVVHAVLIRYRSIASARCSACAYRLPSLYYDLFAAVCPSASSVPRAARSKSQLFDFPDLPGRMGR